MMQSREQYIESKVRDMVKRMEVDEDIMAFLNQRVKYYAPVATCIGAPDEVVNLELKDINGKSFPTMSIPTNISVEGFKQMIDGLKI